MDGALWHCTGDRDQDHPQEKEIQESKMAIWGGLTQLWKKEKQKAKKKKERYTHLDAEFQRIARRDKKAFLSSQCKEIEETTEWKRLEISSRKLEIPREHFMQSESSETDSVVSDSSWPHGLHNPRKSQARILEWVASILLQGIFPS